MPVGFGVVYLVFPVMFLVFAALVVMSAVRGLRQVHIENELAVEYLRASVTGKQIVGGMRRQYRATFMLENSVQVVFLLTRSQYQSLHQKEQGVLACRGKQFLDFAQD